MEQRAKFALVNSELAKFREVIKQGHKDKYAIRTVSGFMLRNGVQGVYPDFTIDYSKINVASGPLPGVSDVIATPDLATTLVNLSWDTTIGVLGVAGSETDILNIVAYNETKQLCIMIESLNRSTGASTVELPEGWFGDEVHIWAYMSSVDGVYNSDSTYVGLTQL